MTPQEIFDKVWQHFITEKSPLSYSPNGMHCLYRGVDPATGGVTKCVVGLFIPDEEYHPLMESIGPVSDLLYGGYASGEWVELLLPHVSLLRVLQSAHDDTVVQNEVVTQHSELERRLRNAARSFGLEVPQETTDER